MEITSELASQSCKTLLRKARPGPKFAFSGIAKTVRESATSGHLLQLGDRGSCFSAAPDIVGDGGEGGIRTHGTVPRTLAFEASTFNRSVTSPQSQMTW